MTHEVIRQEETRLLGRFEAYPVNGRKTNTGTIKMIRKEIGNMTFRIARKCNVSVNYPRWSIQGKKVVLGEPSVLLPTLLIDGYVAGVFGISKMASDSVFVWYVMKVPHKIYRLGRLCYMLAQNREFVDTLLDNIEQEKVTKMRTAMLTRYPENKEVRGIMKLVNRVEDKKNGYKLTYEAELVEGRSEQQTLQEWLRRENEWQKNRAKASSKSKGAK